ncbi:MAG: Gldg family protein [Acidobacteriota bacterium]
MPGGPSNDDAKTDYGDITITRSEITVLTGGAGYPDNGVGATTGDGTPYVPFQEAMKSAQDNYDLGDFGKDLKDKGLTVETLNLAKTPTIPSNTSVLVIDSPQVNLLPGEVKIIRHYVEKGGNLWWMGEPGSLHGLEPLAEELGLDFLPGVIVDPTTQLFGIQNPAFVLVTDYPPDPVTRSMNTVTLFPTSAALDTNDHGHSDWTRTPILTTQARAWTDTGKLSGEIRYNKGTDERPGPLNLGYALTRSTAKQDSGEALPKIQDKGQQILLCNLDDVVEVFGCIDSISHEVIGQSGAGRVLLKPAGPGTGVRTRRAGIRKV